MGKKSFGQYGKEQRIMLEINGHTKQLAIIGWPVEHSFSPKMHNFISERMGNNYVYTALPVEPQNVKAAIDGVRAMNIAGLNVTAPHKFEVMKYIDEIAPQAQRYGSVNTIVNRNGRLCGYNTDADGFYMSMLRNGITAEGKSILIIGAGGATKPLAVLLSEKGAKSITVLNRTREKAEALAAYVKSVDGFVIETEMTRTYYDIVINTTSAGMSPQTDKYPIDPERLSFINSDTSVIDMIYNPPETLFLKLARERGAKTLNGLGMLIGQGIIAYELFTGTALPENMFDIIAKEVFKE